MGSVRENRLCRLETASGGYWRTYKLSGLTNQGPGVIFPAPLVIYFDETLTQAETILRHSEESCKRSCDSPRVDARQFEELVVGLIRSNILTEGNIRSLVNVVDEQMDDVSGDERKRLETIQSELADVRGRLDRLYDLVETTTEFNMADFAHRIRDHKERQERLESAAEGARAILAQRRAVLDDVKTITAYAQDMSRFLQKSSRSAGLHRDLRERDRAPARQCRRPLHRPHARRQLDSRKKVQEIPLNGSVVSSVNGSPHTGLEPQGSRSR